MIYDQDFGTTSNEIDYEYIDWQQPYPYWEPFESSQDAQLPPPIMTNKGQVIDWGGQGYPEYEPASTSPVRLDEWPITFDWDIKQTDIQAVEPGCAAVCVDDPSTPDDWECNAPAWCDKPILVGRLNNRQFGLLMDGVPLELAPKVNVFEELRYDKFSDTVGLWVAYGGVSYDPNPQYRKSAEWSLYEIQKMIAPGEMQPEPRIEPIPINDVKRTTVLNNRWSFYGFEEDAHLVGRFTPEEWLRLQAGNPVDLVVAGENKALQYGLQIAKAPQGLSGYMIFAVEFATPFLLPTARIDSENAPLSGGAVLSDAQIDELAKGSRVYVDESLYYEYTPATDTLRLINEIDDSVVKQGTFQTVLQVNKDGSAVSGGSGILLALGVVGIALSMSNRKSKT